jgi:hypothetical protein
LPRAVWSGEQWCRDDCRLLFGCLAIFIGYRNIGSIPRHYELVVQAGYTRGRIADLAHAILWPNEIKSVGFENQPGLHSRYLENWVGLKNDEFFTPCACNRGEKRVRFENRLVEKDVL